MGDAIGTGLAGIQIAMQQDPDNPGDVKGISQGLSEARLNQQDPMWRLKGQIMANNIQQQKLQLAATGAQVEVQRQENSAWAEDVVPVSKWLSAPLDIRERTPAPDVKSKQGMTLLQKQRIADDQRRLQEQGFETKLQQEQLKAQHAAGVTARISDWNDAIAAADPDTFSAIGAMKNGGRLPNGLPTPEAIARLNDYRRANGMTDYGTKASEYLEKPGKISEEQRVRLQDLNKDESDLRKEIAKAKVDDPGKVAGLQAQLDDVRKQRVAVARGEDVSTDSEKPPTDDLVSRHKSDWEAAKKTLEEATVGGDKKAIGQAKADVATAEKKLNASILMKKGMTLDSSEIDQSAIDKMTKWVNQSGGKDVYYLNQETGEVKRLTPAVLRELQRRLDKDQKPTSTPKNYEEHPPGEAWQNMTRFGGF